MGVHLKVIGRAMVLIVRRDPPGPAQTNQEADPKSDNFVSSQRTNDSPMPGIVAQVSYLPKDESQECGVGQLNPEIIYNYQDGDAEGEQGQCRNDFENVIGWLLIQETLVLDYPP